MPGRGVGEELLGDIGPVGGLLEAGPARMKPTAICVLLAPSTGPCGTTRIGSTCGSSTARPGRTGPEVGRPPQAASTRATRPRRRSPDDAVGRTAGRSPGHLRGHRQPDRGVERERGDVDRGPERRGTVSRKHDPTPGAPHAWSQPWWSRASWRDGQSEAGPAGRPGASGSPRQNRLKTLALSPGRSPTPWSRTETGDRRLVPGDGDDDGATFTMLDGVDDEVAQDPFDPARLDVGDARLRRGDDVDRAAAPLSQWAQRRRPGRPATGRRWVRRR